MLDEERLAEINDAMRDPLNWHGIHWTGADVRELIALVRAYRKYCRRVDLDFAHLQLEDKAG